MPRVRTAWSSIRDDQIYPILRENSAGYWSPTLLLSLANHALDQRALELGEAHEGWISTAYLAPTVANQREYAIPEGTERVRAVYLRYQTGSQLEEIQLDRNDRVGQDYYAPAPNTSFRMGGIRPEYRILDNLILIEPPDVETRTDGLRIESDALPPKLTGDADKLALLWPMSTETLLVYDVVLLALGVEDSQGNQDDNTQAHSEIKRFHRRIETAWRDIIAVRNQSRVYGPAFNLGD